MEDFVDHFMWVALWKRYTEGCLLNCRRCIKISPWHLQWKNAQRDVNTARCMAVVIKAEPFFFAPLQTPFPGAPDGQNLISWRWSLPLPTNPVWWGLVHPISSYRGNTPTHTHRQPQTGPITIRCAAASLARSVLTLIEPKGSTRVAQFFRQISVRTIIPLSNSDQIGRDNPCGRVCSRSSATPPSRS